MNNSFFLVFSVFGQPSVLVTFGFRKVELPLFFSLYVTMELPDDVLKIIREFAKPVFTYFREYRQTLTLHGIESWQKLKEGLLYRPVQILPVLMEYEKAYKDFHKSPNTDLIIDYAKRIKLCETHDALFRILY